MRKKMSMSAKIRRLVNKGFTSKEIVEKLKTNPSLVYTVRWNMKRAERKRTGINVAAAPAAAAAPKKRGRPRKVVAAATTPGAIRQVPYESLIPTQSRSFWQRTRDWLFG